MNLLNFFKKDQNFFPPVFAEKPETKFPQKQRKTKIFVAVSGGVDSSVALAILQEKGYQVEGVFFKKFNPDQKKCQNEREDARKVCQYLGVPFHFLDLEKEYKEKILKYFIESYQKGETPNPDILCNKYIKFGTFLQFAEKNGADFIATGHYAKKIFLKNTKKSLFCFFNKKKFWKKFSTIFFLSFQTSSALKKSTEIFFQNFVLKKSKDKNKDQTYFLSMLSQKQLSKSIFPLGDLEKVEVRKIAEKLGLLTAKKKDSQGICFLGKKIKLTTFLSNYIQTKNGGLLNKNGEIIGKHFGVPFYTIGQRHNFEIFPKFKTTNQKPLFVISKNIKKNTITVDEKYLSKKIIIVQKINWISKTPDFSKKYQARIRYRGELISVKIKELGNIESIKGRGFFKKTGFLSSKFSSKKYELTFTKPHYSVASGQFVVLYDKNICLGGGEII